MRSYFVLSITLAAALALTPCQQEAAKPALLGAYRPQCTEDGLYAVMQYHGSTGHRWCVDPKTGSEILNSRRTPNEQNPDCEAIVRAAIKELTPCQSLAAQPHLLGAFRPQCTDDGLFSKMQCHGSTGQCWCVDQSSGAELLDSRRRPGENMPDCEAQQTTSEPRPLTECQKLAQRRPRLIGAYVPQCTTDGNFSPLQCHGSTGHCWCVDQSGHELGGTRMHASQGRPMCTAQQQSVRLLRTHQKNVVRALVESTCEKEAAAPPMPGSYRPQCLDDGSYAPMQYHGSTGHRWCVDPKTGVELLNTRRGPTQESPDCGSTHRNVFDMLTPCELQASQPYHIGAFRPQCSSGLFAPLQCHGSTGYCWCVEQNTGVELKGTRRGPGQGMPNCEETVSEPMDLTECQQLANQRRIYLGAFVPQCNEDGSYSPMQCHGSTGHCWCVDKSGHELVGTRLSAVEGRPDCSAGDADNNAPSRVCSDSPMVADCFDYCDSEYTVNAHETTLATLNCKIGCEAAAALEPCGLAEIKTDGVCHHDGESCINFCNEINPFSESFSQPCLNGVFYQRNKEDPSPYEDITPFGKNDCVVKSEPSLCQKLSAAPAMLGAYRPQCLEDGSFAPMQYHGSTGHRWCVDRKTGVELLNTRRGPSEKNPECESKERQPIAELTPCQEQEAQPLLLGAFRPHCNDDGSYSAIQCHGSTGHCWCVEESTGTELLNTRRMPGQPMPDCKAAAATQATVELSECQKLTKQRSGFIGAYVPQCLEDGSFSPTQCHGSTGHCWCVNELGQELEGTRIHGRNGRPDCTKDNKQNKALRSEKHTPSHPMTPCERQASVPSMPGSYRPQCLEDGSYAPMQYHGSTGHSWCVDPKTGVELLNTRRGPSESRVDCMSILAPVASPSPCKQVSDRPHLLGAYVPQCDDDGSFSSMQCHGSSGHCWCVDQTTGAERDRTRRGPGQLMPDCSQPAESATEVPSPCQAAVSRASRLLGAFIPSCDENGNFEPMQCHGSTGHCWCVDVDGREVANTRLHASEGQLPACTQTEGNSEDDEAEERDDGGFLNTAWRWIMGGCGIAMVSGVIFIGAKKRKTLTHSPRNSYQAAP